MTEILVNGCRGKLGTAICHIADTTAYRQLLSICAGVDIAEEHGLSVNSSFPLFSDIKSCDMPADVIIDCSTARVAPEAVKYAIARKTPILVCTTGLSDDTIGFIENEASKHIAVFRSANMSLGVAVAAGLAERAVVALGETFDVEIVEKHHNQKADSPSGTAVTIAEAVARAAREGSGRKFDIVYGREKMDFKKRGKNELGIHAVRGGTITGEHSVIFAGNDEVIEIKHIAYSKNVFAEGAVRAAMFLAGKPAGLYTMRDLA
jgi:4-hydroxy-tetrahydrodipicolinate reductase